MKKSTKGIFAAVLIVALIAGVSIYLSGGTESLQGRFGPRFSSQFSSFRTPTKPVLGTSTAPSKFNLQVETSGNTSEPIVYGADAEVFRFDLTAKGAYTLRYLTVDFSLSGLANKGLLSPVNWKIYEVENGVVNWANQIGEGAKFKSGQMRVKTFNGANPSSPYGFSSPASTKTFIVSSQVIDDGIDNVNSISVRMSPASSLSADMDWAWRIGEISETWANSTATLYGAANVDGLPTTYVTRS